MDESIIKLKYKKCKYKVKKWESEFKEKYGVNPSKADIKQAPSKIKEAYRIYYLLKTQALENTLLDVTLDEDTQDCFSLINSSNINFSFAGLDNTITQVDDNSIYNNITLDEIVYNKGDETCDTSTIINKNEKGINNENNFINESLDINVSEGKKDDKTVNDCNVTKVISEKVDKTVNDCDLAGVISDKTEAINENIEKSLNDSFVNSDKVWGKHLNNKVSNKNGKDIKSKPLKPLSYSFSEKLFQNFSVKLRNPRRDISFKCKNKTHEKKDNVNYVDATNIESSGTNDNSSINKQSYISTDKSTGNINKNDSVSAFNIFDEKGKVIIKSTPNINKSANVSCNTATSNTIVLKSFDKGWLERTNTYNKLSSSKNSSDLIDSGFESAESSYVNNSNENKLNDKLHQCDKNIASESDDDIVYNSDSETETKSQSLFNIPKIKRSFDKIEENNETSCNMLLKKPKLFEESRNLLFQNDSKIENNLFVMNVNSETVINKDQKLNSNLKQKPMNDTERKEELLRKKVASGKANNNFVRINIQKKVYVRGRKTMTYSKYKKNQWKKKKDQLQKSDDFNGTKGVFKCYKCGDVGHYARNCTKGLDRLIPKEDIDDEDDSPFPTLEEAEEMAEEAAERVYHRKQRCKNVPSETGEENEQENETEAVSLQEIDSEVKVATLPPLFKLNEDNSIIDTPLIVNQALLEFGHNQFHPGQETAIMRILSGLSTLVTLSTGSGKSLCYQLPAYLFQKLSKISGITLVVSPLVSLMEDQVTCMSNTPIKMGCLHMNQTQKQRLAVLEQLKDGLLTVLIVSPETVVSGDSRPGSLSNELQKLPPITFACIDEVHCVSQWSHNFRPSYLVLCKVLKERFGVKTFLGLTATATKSTIKDIVEHLSVPDGLDGVISNVPLPLNLVLSVSKDYDRNQALVKLLQSNRFKYPASVIIYCTRREDCERIAAYIRTCLQDEALLYAGKKKGRLSTIAEPYHAGLTAPKRKQVQNAFMSGQLRIVVATIAFGMGINKPDVRGVIHYNMPSSFESYVQEVGRAGRDGLEANCHVFLDSRGGDLNELRRHIYANSMDRHTLRKLLQRIFVSCQCKSDCSTHEVAFSVSDTVQALDVKEETISTLLSYLELHDKKWIINLPHTYTMCKVQSYKGAKHLRSLARKCPPLAVAVARELKKGTKPEKLNILNFPVIELASSMNWDSGSVKYHLKQLEWAPNVNGVRCRSGLLIEFSELGFRVKAAGNMSNEELDFALDSLHQRVKNQENTALSQLHIIFQTLTNVTCETVDDCLDKADLSNSDKLKSIIRDYFENPVEESPSIPLHQEKLENEAQIISDIRNLVFSYKDCSFTGRSIARVFHGIDSPNFPAVVMSRSRLWRAHLDQDFILLCNLASRELLRMR